MRKRTANRFIKVQLDPKFIQQHLANERTFLAWIRTAIAIIGVGFLVTNLHYTMAVSLTPWGNQIADMIGLCSVFLGILTIILSTIDYWKKTEEINAQTYTASRGKVLTVAAGIILISLVFGVYFLILNR